MHSHTSVAIIGGGPVGLVASLLLSREGIAHTVFERHTGTSIHPKAIGLNQRTIETFRELGLEDLVRSSAAPPELVGRTSWYTSFTGPTELHGRRLAIRDAWGGGAYAEEYAAVSPCAYTMLPQIRLEPILREAAEAAECATISFGSEVAAIRTDDDGAELTVRDLATGETRSVAARYVIVADGGKGLGEQLGIPDHGERDLLDMVSVHFSADLSGLVGDPGSLITWFINPDFGGSIGSGYLYHIGPWEAGNAKEWVFACAFTAQDPERFDEDAMVARIARSLGTDDFAAEVHSISHWYIQAVVAERFREGSAFLVGDAAHRIPPWGALGLNTGIGDVRNLVWKLSAALREPAHAGLIDSYESERLPIARAVAARSLANFQAHGGIIDRALGIDPAAGPEAGWRSLAALWEPGAAGDERQAKLRDALDVLDEEFHAHGTECGYHYERGALVRDGEPDGGEGGFGSLVYTPVTAAGHHLPHAWLRQDGEIFSTIDLPDPGGWTLLVDAHDAPEAASDAWREAVAGLSPEVRALVRLTWIGGEGGPVAADGIWAERRGISPGGAILVRPDRIVSWRGDDASAAGRLAGALSAMLDAQVRA